MSSSMYRRQVDYLRLSLAQEKDIFAGIKRSNLEFTALSLYDLPKCSWPFGEQGEITISGQGIHYYEFLSVSGIKFSRSHLYRPYHSSDSQAAITEYCPKCFYPLSYRPPEQPRTWNTQLPETDAHLCPTDNYIVARLNRSTAIESDQALLLPPGFFVFDAYKIDSGEYQTKSWHVLGIWQVESQLTEDHESQEQEVLQIRLFLRHCSIFWIGDLGNVDRTIGRGMISAAKVNQEYRLTLVRKSTSTSWSFTPLAQEQLLRILK